MNVLLLPLVAAISPRNAILADNIWRSCDEQTGFHNITLWPTGDWDRAQAVNISSKGTEWIHWLHPVKSVEWICDKMQVARRITFDSAREWWSVSFATVNNSSSQDRVHVSFNTFHVNNTAKPRDLIVRNGSFVDRKTGKAVLLQGANVIMKGPPWFPSTDGNTICRDRWWSNFTCKTFNKYDAMNLKANGYNFIRLGVVWAGGQPTEEPKLDAAWLRRLHAILNITLEHGIHVLFDVHQDAVGTATCGEGVPQWFSAKATPDHIGKPLIPIANVSIPGLPDWPRQADGLCMTNDTTTWALHKGDPNYNTKNPCCLRYNQGGNAWGRLVDTWQAQETIHYQLSKNGRGYYARYMGLLAEAARNYPNVFGIETMNEPPSIERWSMFYTWRAAYDAIRAEVPDMAVSVQDVGQGPLVLYDLGLWKDQIYWLHHADNLFYTFHWYSFPKDPKDGVSSAVKQSKYWSMPALMTEMNNCKVKGPAVAAGIGYSWWEYANYCNTAPSAACQPGDKCDFGACITGVDGNANFTCPPDDADASGSSEFLI